MQKQRQIENEILVLRSQQNDAIAFADLVSEWQKPLWRHAYRLTGDHDQAWDAVQEAWAAIVKGIRKLHDPSAFPAWAYSIVSRKCADLIRKRQRERPVDNPVVMQGHHDDQSKCSDRSELMQLAVNKMPPETRALLSLKYVEGYSTSEISALLSIPEGTVKSRLFSARKQLQEQLEHMEND